MTSSQAFLDDPVWLLSFWRRFADQIGLKVPGPQPGLLCRLPPDATGSLRLWHLCGPWGEVLIGVTLLEEDTLPGEVRRLLHGAYLLHGAQALGEDTPKILPTLLVEVTEAPCMSLSNETNTLTQALPHPLLASYQDSMPVVRVRTLGDGHYTLAGELQVA